MPLNSGNGLKVRLSEHFIGKFNFPMAQFLEQAFDLLPQIPAQTKKCFI